MKALLAAALLAACSFEHGVLVDRDALGDTQGDTRIDTRPSDAKATDARACPAAPANCTSFTCPGSSSCYYDCGQTTTSQQAFFAAASACTNANLGCMVTINDQAEQDCITTMTQPSFPSAIVWIGYEQYGNPQTPGQNWRWHCGTSTYVISTWGSFEPNDADGIENAQEDCAALTNGGGWFDASCTGKARYVCELP